MAAAAAAAAARLRSVRLVTPQRLECAWEIANKRVVPQTGAAATATANPAASGTPSHDLVPHSRPGLR